MSGGFILLVEDNADDELLTLEALRSAKVGNDVAVARDGQEALDFIQARGVHADRDARLLPSVVLLDLGLPTLNGIEVLKALRSDDRTRTLPVVVLTSSKEQRDAVAAYQFGANSFVRKPVGFAEFAAAVGQLGLYWHLLNQHAA